LRFKLTRRTMSDSNKDLDGAYGGVAPTRQPNDLKVAPDSFSNRSLQRSTNMGIIRREKSENYSVIYNECFQNPGISARAKGIFAYLMTLPDDWKIYKRELSKHFKEGRDALNKAFEELEDAGYITKVPERVKGGMLAGWDYTVYESTELLITRKTDNPCDGKPVTTKYLALESTKDTNTVGAKAPVAEHKESSDHSKKNQSSDQCCAFFEEFKSITGKNLRIQDPKFKRQFSARLKDGFTLDEMVLATKNAYGSEYHTANRNYLTPEFITRADKLQNYINFVPESGGSQKSRDEAIAEKSLRN
jgi:predicted transcriptional regulator